MIVDASVALKWIVVEPDSEPANALIVRGDLHAPDLIFSEIANALWKKSVRAEIARLPHDLDRFHRIFDSIEPSGSLLRRATELAIELTHPAYDCFYLALPERRADVLVTADQRFLRVVTTSPYARLVRAFGAI